VARMGEGRNVYRVLVGKPGGKRPLGRPRRRWDVMHTAPALGILVLRGNVCKTAFSVTSRLAGFNSPLGQTVRLRVCMHERTYVHMYVKGRLLGELYPFV
jgi:hypothetical protein